jgi:hypothetical protein
MDWFRSHHGAPTDPKWLTIGRRARVRPGDVAAIVWALLDHASQNEDDRGSIAGFDVEALADFYQYDVEQIEAVVAALVDKGIIAGNRFSAWGKRQPKRERPDDNSASRVKAFREKHKASEMGVTSTVTPCNAAGRQETPREEEIRGEKSSGTNVPGADAPPPLEGMREGGLLPEPERGASKIVPASRKFDTPEKRLFARGREVLGANAGGMITRLRTKLNHDDEHALRTINLAAEKENPREWVGRLLAGDSTAEAGDYVSEVRRRNQEWGLL